MASQFMGLSLPVVSQTPGPQWASMLSAALVQVDQHDHTPGFGKQIASAALNINADVSWAGFNLTGLRASRFQNLGAVPMLATDLCELAVVGGDLYFKNGAGQAIQVTAGAALNAASLSGFGGDYATSGASAVYVSASQTFQFFQAANKYANLDAGSVIIRDPGATSPKGITLKSPTSLAADYALTLLSALPASTLPLSVSATGVITAGQIATAQIADLSITGAKLATSAADAFTLEVAAGAMRVKDGGVTAAKTDAVSVATASKLMVRDSSGRCQVADPSASSDIATKNYVDQYARARAWARVQIQNSGAAIVVAGFNVASASWAGNNLTVNFASPMPNANYCAVVGGGQVGYIVTMNPVTSTSGAVVMTQAASGGTANDYSAGYVYHVVVFA